MKKANRLIVFALAALVLSLAPLAQAQDKKLIELPDRSQDALTLRQPLDLPSIDGSKEAVVESGNVRVMSVVGQAIAGDLNSRSGSIWKLKRKVEKEQEAAAALEEAAAEDLPTVFELHANYPNPFNPQTTIRFSLPEASPVRIQVYDMLGREVALLVDGEIEAGHHNVMFNAQHLASGVYLYHMKAGTFTNRRTMLLVK